VTIPVIHVDEHVKRLLVEYEDTDELAAFPQSVRFRAIEEAVIAIARLRPDLFAKTVDAAYDADTDSFQLPAECDYPREVIGLRDSETRRIMSLRSSTEADRVDQDACWRTDQGDEASPTYYVWSPHAPRNFYIDGYRPSDTLVITASGFDGFDVNGNVTELPLPYTYFPEIVDYALSRLYAREDTSAGDSNFYLQRFNQLMNDQLGTDRNRNPLQAAMMKARQS